LGPKASQGVGERVDALASAEDRDLVVLCGGGGREGDGGGSRSKEEEISRSTTSCR